VGVLKRTHNAPTQNQGVSALIYFSSRGLLPPLKPGIPRGRDAYETGAGLQGRHPICALNSIEPGIRFPPAVAGLPIEVVSQAGREVLRRPVHLGDTGAAITFFKPVPGLGLQGFPDQNLDIAGYA